MPGSVQGRLGRGLGAAPSRPPALRSSGRTPPAPAQHPSASGVHGTRMTLVSEGTVWRARCADGEGSELSICRAGDVVLLLGPSSGFRETESRAGACSPLPHPSSSPPFPGARISGLCGIALRGLGPSPPPQPSSHAPTSDQTDPVLGETETQNGGGMCSNHSLSATEPRPDPRTPPARLPRSDPGRQGRAATPSPPPFQWVRAAPSDTLRPKGTEPPLKAHTDPPGPARAWGEDRSQPAAGLAPPGPLLPPQRAETARHRRDLEAEVGQRLCLHV